MGLFDAKGIYMLAEQLLLRGSAKVFVEHFTGPSKHPPDRAHMTTSNRTHHTGLDPSVPRTGNAKMGKIPSLTSRNT